MALIEGILTGAPIWVWPLLAGLVAVGYRSSKDRNSPVALFYALPLMGLFSFRGLSLLAHPAVAWVCYSLAFLMSAFLFYRLQSRWLVGRTGSFVMLRGEWVTMTMILIIFMMNFIAGILEAIQPALFQSTGFTIVFTVMVGSASASFLGRSVRVLRS